MSEGFFYIIYNFGSRSSFSSPFLNSPRFVVTLDGLSMPTETLKISPVATETTPRKSVKERLGTRVRGVATPHVPASTVTGEEENKEEEGEEQGEILLKDVSFDCCVSVMDVQEQ